MKAFRRIALGICAAALLAGSAWAADEASRKAALAKDAECTTCHNEGWRVPVLSVYQTKHGNRADSRAPTCQGCHGASDGHKSDPGKAPDVVFAPKSKNASHPEEANGACLGCHQ